MVHGRLICFPEAGDSINVTHCLQNECSTAPSPMVQTAKIVIDLFQRRDSDQLQAGPGPEYRRQEQLGSYPPCSDFTCQIHSNLHNKHSVMISNYTITRCDVHVVMVYLNIITKAGVVITLSHISQAHRARGASSRSVVPTHKFDTSSLP